MSSPATLGSGIDLNSTQYSLAQGNVANGNGVGINVADDLGRLALYNTIDNNVTNLNFGGCGIALASHTGAGVAGNDRHEQPLGLQRLAVTRRRLTPRRAAA